MFQRKDCLSRLSLPYISTPQKGMSHIPVVIIGEHMLVFIGHLFSPFWAAQLRGTLDDPTAMIA